MDKKHNIIMIYEDENGIEKEQVIASGFKTRQEAEKYCEENEQRFDDELCFLSIYID